MYAFIHLIIHSFVRSFVCSLVRSFVLSSFFSILNWIEIYILNTEYDVVLHDKYVNTYNWWIVDRLCRGQLDLFPSTKENNM